MNTSTATLEETTAAQPKTQMWGGPQTSRGHVIAVPINAFPLDQGLEKAFAAKVEDPADVVETRMARRDLEAAMAQLSEVQRQVLVLRLGLDQDLDEDRTWSVVAAATGMTLHGVQKAFRDATAFLRTSLAQPEFALAA